MPEIVLTEEQARVVAGATTAVVIRNPGGAAVGAIDPREAEWIAEAKRRLATESGQGIPHETVMARLAALQTERDRAGSDPARVVELLAELRASGQ